MDQNETENKWEKRCDCWIEEKVSNEGVTKPKYESIETSHRGFKEVQLYDSGQQREVGKGNTGTMYWGAGCRDNDWRRQKHQDG